MEKLLKWLFLLLLIGNPFPMEVLADVTYVLNTKYSLRTAYKFDSEHGIEWDNFGVDDWGKITVEVTTKDNVSINGYHGPITLYKAYVNRSVQSNGLQHLGVVDSYWTRNRTSFQWGTHGAYSDDKDFYKNQAYAADKFLKSTHSNWFKWGHQNIDVIVTLTIEGNGVKLSDVQRIKVPGAPTWYADSFIEKNKFQTEHGCHEEYSTVCSRLKSVRGIIDLEKTDMVIQAHRGVWGKPNTNQENTIGAMRAAKNAGIILLESDIMPIHVSNYDNPGDMNTFGEPGGLAAFHDFVLDRYTSANSGFIFNSSRGYLSGLSLNKPRSETVGSEKIMFFDELMDYAVSNDLIVCVDMKNLESKGQGENCTELCDWQRQDRKNISLYNNLKYAINTTSFSGLKHIAIKTYASYSELKSALTSGPNAISVAEFNQVLWAPLLAPNPRWEEINGTYSPYRIQQWLEEWFAHNESVLYYETNFFNSYDNKSSIMLVNTFRYFDQEGVHFGNIMEYIYKMTGRRAGIFSEEPVGGKGTVNRWGKWKIKKPVSDRRGDHLWLLSQPYFKHAVITTDRPDIWKQLND